MLHVAHISKNWDLSSIFLFISVFSIELAAGEFKIRRRLDSNRGSLVSEAITLPTALQPLSFPTYIWRLTLFKTI